MEGGERIGGRYEILGPVGAGGHGVVFEALDHRTGRRVAIKRAVHPPKSDAERKAFMREATLLASIQSPHVVRLIDVVDDEVPYLVMSLLSGRTLAEQIAEEGVFDSATSLQIIDATLAGLTSVHSRALVHGDVKPGNVFLRDDGGLQLIDFGISRASSDRWDPTRVLGTLIYLSPEALSQRRPDARSDLYAVGLILYELIAGAHPFESVGSQNATIEAIRMGLCASLTERAPGVDPALAAFVETAMAVDPDERFVSAQEMRLALGFLRRSERVNLHPSPAGQAQIASVLAESRLARIVDEQVRVRFERSGEGTEVFHAIQTSAWLSLDDYCRLLDAAYFVRGEGALVAATRAQVVEDARNGRFAAIPTTGGPAGVAEAAPAFWDAAFRNVGTLLAVRRGQRVELSVEGGQPQMDRSPGWRATLAGSLAGMLDALGVVADIRVLDSKMLGTTYRVDVRSEGSTRVLVAPLGR